MTESFEKILQAIRHYCNYRERCHQEVRYKLVDLGARGDDLETLLSMLVSEDLLNEGRYARAFVRGKFVYNHWGRVRIIRQLRQKDVSEYCIKKGLLEIDEVEYRDCIARLAAQKQEALKNEKHPGTQKQKAIRYLLQKGFEYEIVLSVMNRELPS